MALKGSTKIELTNVHTGKKEVVEHHNMITNVLSDMNHRVYGFNNMNPFIFIYAKNFLPDNNTPFWRAMFSGILLFEDSLSDNADEYIFPAGNKVTACGNVDRVKTSDMTDATISVLGNFNSDESVIKENTVKLVYDFPTSAGNGQISSIALCNHLLSRSIYNYDTNMSVNPVVSTVTSGWSGWFMKNVTLDAPYVSNDGTVYTISFYDDNVGDLTIKLSSKLNQSAMPKTSKKTVSVDLGDSNYSEYSYIPDKNIIVFSNGTSCKYVCITDGIVYEKTIPTGYDKVKVLDGYFVCIKKSDSLYNYSILSDDGTVLHENFFTYSSIIQCQCGLFSGRYGLLHDSTYGFLFDVTTGGVSKFYLKLERYGTYNGVLFDNILHNYQFTNGYYQNYYNFGYSTWQPWLTTKNNLDTPVTKTADKTMKVTYTLTEA